MNAGQGEDNSLAAIKPELLQQQRSLKADAAHESSVLQGSKIHRQSNVRFGQFPKADALTSTDEPEARALTRHQEMTQW